MGQIGWRVDMNFLYYHCNISVNLKLFQVFFLRVRETLMFTGWSLPPSVQCHGFVWSKPHLLHEPGQAWYRCQAVVNVECHCFHAKLGTRGHLTLAVRVPHISTWSLTGLQETSPHPKCHLSGGSNCKLGWVFTTSEPHLPPSGQPWGTIPFNLPWNPQNPQHSSGVSPVSCSNQTAENKGIRAPLRRERSGHPEPGYSSLGKKRKKLPLFPDELTAEEKKWA